MNERISDSMKACPSFGIGNPWALAAILGVLCLCPGSVRAQYAGGSGVSDDPYLIATAEQMNSIGLDPNDWDKHFKLMADIDLSAYRERRFNTIGTGEVPFIGVFDGNGHGISNFGNYAYSIITQIPCDEVDLPVVLGLGPLCDDIDFVPQHRPVQKGSFVPVSGPGGFSGL